MREFKRLQLSQKDIQFLLAASGKARKEDMKEFTVKVISPPSDRYDNPIGYSMTSPLLEVEWMEFDGEE